jgi:hypothetical protein
LNLVEDHEAPVLGAQVAAGIGEFLEIRRVLQVEIEGARPALRGEREGPRQGGLADLPGTEQCHGGKLT